MNLSHFSDRIVNEVKNKEQGDDAYKPKGLWVSVDGEYDWPSWCEAENFRNCQEQYHYAVSLAENHNVLILDQVHKVVNFKEEYKAGSEYFKQIDWARVAKKHDGIIIAPYQWSLRMADGYNWYYGWDCASGCIWNAKAIGAIELIKEKMVA